MLIIFFILGLIVGSFLNVVVYRLNVAETILGRSKCPHCKRKIRWQDNIPLLSFVLLKARCRDCEEKISWQYPLVEILTGIVFAATAAFFLPDQSAASWFSAVFYLGLFSILIIIAAYDFQHMEVPMLPLWLGVGWFFAFWLLSSGPDSGLAEKIFSGGLWPFLLSGAGAFLFFFALSYGSKEKWMGAGDAYVALLGGLLAGWPGVIFMIALASMIGSFAGIALIIAKRKTLKSRLPFAPFLAAGAALTVFLPQIFPGLKFWLWCF